jgi:N-acetyl-gamma-glutamyl-phosphate reductase
LLRVGIIGASGYTGAELLRILAQHPEMEVTLATAREYGGERISALYPSLGEFYDDEFKTFEKNEVETECDAVFIGLPHGESMKVVPGLMEMGKKIVDLSADFRFDEPAVYEKWYGTPHSCPELLREAVYGLPESNRKKIAGAQLVANPGCYPTAVALGLLPLAKGLLVADTVFIDAKSGISGAGRKPTLQTHFPQLADGVVPYAVPGHRHQPEMELLLAGASGGGIFPVVFIPHLVPMNRGILCTMYALLKDKMGDSEIWDLYNDAYSDEGFVHLLNEGECPQTKAVQGSNYCHIGLAAVLGGEGLVVMSAIDNLVKGASGQAVQNMNLLCGLPEDTGLLAPGLFP